MADKFGLTNRERDVLRALVLTEDKNLQIANDLGISRRQLQTHISRIYQKTDASRRAGPPIHVCLPPARQPLPRHATMPGR